MTYYNRHADEISISRNTTKIDPVHLQIYKNISTILTRQSARLEKRNNITEELQLCLISLNEITNGGK